MWVHPSKDGSFEALFKNKGRAFRRMQALHRDMAYVPATHQLESSEKPCMWKSCEQTAGCNHCYLVGEWDHCMSQPHTTPEDLLLLDPLLQWTNTSRVWPVFAVWPANLIALFVLFFSPSWECWWCGVRNQRHTSHPHGDKNHHLWVCRGTFLFYAYVQNIFLEITDAISCPPGGSRVQLWNRWFNGWNQ